MHVGDGRFEIKDLIASGGESRVYEAVEHLPEGRTRRAAVKFVLAEGTARALDESRSTSFQRQVDVLLAASDHPNIVTIRGYGECEEQGPWIAMEYADRTVKDLVDALPASPALVRSLLVDGLSALRFLHESDEPILHRDVKPSNILYHHGFKLCDFGIAKRAEDDETCHLRTLQYCAPELIDGEIGPQTESADLYSLGIAVYELALGRRRFRYQFPSVYDPQASHSGEIKSGVVNDAIGPRWMYWHTSPDLSMPPLKSILEDYPEDISDVVEMMTRKAPADRVSSAAVALEKIDRSAAPPAELLEDDEEEEGEESKTRTLLLLAVTVVLLLASAFFILDDDPEPARFQVANDGVFRSQGRTVFVEGTIENAPANVAIVVRSEYLGEKRGTINRTNDQFRVDVPMKEPGTELADVALLDSRGNALFESQVTIVRDTPETVLVVLATREKTSGALIRVADAAGSKEFTSDSAGEVTLQVTYGEFRVGVEHPRIRPYDQSHQSGAEDNHRIELALKPYGRAAVDLSIRQKLDEIRDLARVAETDNLGVGDALEEIGELLADLALLLPEEKGEEEQKTLLTVQLLAGWTAKAKEGNEEALGKLLSSIRDGELDEAFGLDGRLSEGGLADAPGSDRATVRRGLVVVRDEFIDQLIEGVAIDLEELSRLLDQITALDNVGSGEAVRSFRDDKTEQMKLDAAASAEGDGEAGKRLRADARTLDIVRDTQSLDLNALSVIEISQWPAEILRANLELWVPYGALQLSVDPYSVKVRINGSLLTENEVRRVANRVRVAESRLLWEVDSQEWSIADRLGDRLVRSGAEDVSVRPIVTGSESTLWIAATATDRCSAERIHQIASTFVSNPELLDVDIRE